MQSGWSWAGLDSEVKVSICRANTEKLEPVNFELRLQTSSHHNILQAAI